MKALIVGLDPGSGSSSPTGLVVVEPESRALLYSANLRSKAKDQSKRLFHLHEQTADIIGAIDPELALYVFVESFVIRGKANQILQQVIGALKSAVPERAYLADVPNTTVKRIVAGSGKADKPAVAAGVYHWASSNEETKAKLMELIKAGEADILDAFAIAIAGWEGLDNAATTAT